MGAEHRSHAAQELTSGPGYDYQPDWSSDGRWIVYTKYDKDAIALWAYEVASKKAHPLTRDTAVNVEPRFSPDGKRIAFVSTAYNGRFHIFAGRFEDGELRDIQRITGENKSSLPRYYYSDYDHEISPAWSPDGSDLLFVSNRRTSLRDGWLLADEGGAGSRGARNPLRRDLLEGPSRFSPDGKRIVYASYLGRAWHQMWVMPAEGGDAFPLTYGDYDNINPRWSPDGTAHCIHFESRRKHFVVDSKVPGGDQQQHGREGETLLVRWARSAVTVSDETGHETAARVSSQLKTAAPMLRAMHGCRRMTASIVPSVRSKRTTSKATAKQKSKCPAGTATVEVMKGFEYAFRAANGRVKAGQVAKIVRPSSEPSIYPTTETAAWVSGDVHVHMNYAGAYRNTPAHLVFQAAAENLPIVEDLVVNKEQRIPDMAYFRTTPDPASTAENLLLHGQEFHTSYWGHLGLLHLTQHFLFPDYCRVREYGRSEPVSDQRHRSRHGARTAGRWSVTFTRSTPIRTRERNPYRRTASGCRAGQGGLHRGRSASATTSRQRASGTGFELRIPPARGGGNGRNG